MCCSFECQPSGDTGTANPAARNGGNSYGTGKRVPFVNRTFEWGVIISTVLSVLSIVPRRCARLAYFLHPKLRKINAVLPQLSTLTLRRLRGVEAFPLPLHV